MNSSQLYIDGCWTKAGVASCVHVKGPQVDLLFDCGVNESEIASANHVFISHGHLDHAGACVLHARSRALSHQPATYYIPEIIQEPLQQVKQAFEVMDDRTIPMNIKVVKPGDIITLTAQYKVHVFPTIHRVPSQGYAVYHVSKGKLLPEYEGKTPAEIKALKSQGISIISPPIETLDVVYTGDTTFEGVMTNPLVFGARILIMECTYLDGPQEKALQWSHIHIADIVQNYELFQNENIVLVHLSQKYSFNRAVELIRLQLPDELLDRVQVNLKTFGSNEVLTDVSDNKWSHAKQTRPGWGWVNRSNQGYFRDNKGNGNQWKSKKSRDSGYDRNHAVQPPPPPSAPVAYTEIQEVYQQQQRWNYQGNNSTSGGRNRKAAFRQSSTYHHNPYQG